jgi:hypothetical protein
MHNTPSFGTVTIELPLRLCGPLRTPAHASGVEAVAVRGTYLRRAGSR